MSCTHGKIIHYLLIVETNMNEKNQHLKGKIEYGRIKIPAVNAGAAV